MKKFILGSMAALAVSGLITSTAAAQTVFPGHIVPPSTTFTATGPATLNGISCNLTISGSTNADLGLPAPHLTHTDGGSFTGTNTSGDPLCPLITVDSADFTVTSFNPATGAATLNLTNVVVSVAGNPTCVDAGPIALTGVNTALGIDVVFNNFIDTCTVTARLSNKSGLTFVE